MLARLVDLSLRHRLAVLAAATLLVVAGWVTVSRMPVDVFPDLSAPTVTVITEGLGMAPEELELLVTFPLESALNGAPGVRRVRSVSAAGISVIWTEFEWGQDIYRARQVVSERIRKVELPAQASAPELGPISSIMGEITFIALTADPAEVSAGELRTLASTVIRRSLLAIPGISQVAPIGGDVREYQVEVDVPALLQHGVRIEEIADALERSTRSPAAGFHVDRGQEYLVRGLARAGGADDLAAAIVREIDGVPLTVDDLAEVRVGAEPQRGTASYNAHPAVILSVQKQPGTNTLDLMEDVNRVLDDLVPTLPAGVVIERENFRQSDFIQTAIHNVTEALRDGAVLVVIVLLLFLGNLRTTLISALAIPLSLLAAVLVLSAFGGTINTMTIGGFTIAIGALVDDAIVVVENVFRRLREAPPRDDARAIQIIREAATSVVGAVFFATLIIVLVFIPLFFLPGMEGRLLRPLGLAYLIALVASLFVSVTITPALAYLLLRRTSSETTGESWVLRRLGAAYRRGLASAMRRPWAVVGLSVALLAVAIALLPLLGRSFLPAFNEGSLTVSVVSAPGITLEESDAVGRAVEEVLLGFPEVVSTSRRTGRAEKDEHVQGVNASEMEVVLRSGIDKERLLAEMRDAVTMVPGASVSFGQPISHRIDHMISGSKSNLAVKVFGAELGDIRQVTGEIEQVLRAVPGIVDVSNQEQASIPQLLIDLDRPALTRHGLDAAEVAQLVEAAFQGTEVGEILEAGVSSRVVVRLPERLREHRDLLPEIPVIAHGGRVYRLGDVADVRFDLGPSMIRREDVQRLGMVTANVSGADLAGTVEAAMAAVDRAVTLPPGVRVTFGGQFEEGARSARNILWLSILVLIGMYAALLVAFRSHRQVLVVLVNLPLALIGGIVALAIGERVLSVATLVGFITLFGIATRNGVLLVTRYQDLLREGRPLEEAVRLGSEERLAPVLMTALTAGLALVPLVIAGHEPGNEIQSPMGQVILGGLLTSTFLNLVLVPVLFVRFGVKRTGIGTAVG